jgi:apolipoprotein N-acyltransferase
MHGPGTDQVVENQSVTLSFVIAGFAVDPMRLSGDASRMINGSGWQRLVAALLSGLLAAGLFAPFDVGVLVWVAMLPLLWALGSVSGKRVGWKGFALGMIAGTVASAIQFNWLETVSWLAAVLLPLYLAIFWGLFGAFATTLGKSGRGRWSAFSQAAVWAGLEWLRGWLFTGFSWNGLGVAFHETPLIAQGADLLGVTGLSMMVVFVQATLLGAPREKSWKRWDLGLAATFVGFLLIYGKIRLSTEAAHESLRLKTLLVQINIPQEAGQVLWTDLQIHEAYEEETLKALENTDPSQAPDWVMWPECALTGRILRSADGQWGTWQINHDTISQVRAAGSFSLIYGVNELEAERDGENLVPIIGGRAYNSIAVMSPENVLQTYRKRHLVIFGETIPLVDRFPFLKEIYEQQSGMVFGGSFTPGDSLESLPIVAGKTTLSAIPTVCFEDSVARLTRKFVRPEPQVIINVTNDGWFKESVGAAQHFANAKFRSIELRRPMLRCANTGVSAAVDTTGSTAHPDSGVSQVLVDENGSHFTRGTRLVELDIPLQPSTTLFALIGDWGILVLAAVGLGISIIPRRNGQIATNR